MVKENNGIYAVSCGNIDDPDYITVSIIRNFVPLKGFSLEYLSYVAKAGRLPFEAKMIVHFTINPIDEANSIFEVNQTGIPDDPIADDYFEGCQAGWNHVLNNIKNYCEKI